MIFDAKIHTKTHLLEDTSLLHKLSEDSPEFAQSELAADFDILRVRFGAQYQCIAHTLAENRPEWLKNPASKERRVLELKDAEGFCVAHYLAKNQMLWAEHTESKDINILKLHSKDSSTVAMYLARYNSSWISSLSLENLDIFAMPMEILDGIESDETETIAEYIISKEPSALRVDVLNSMEFITLRTCMPYVGAVLAHRLAVKHCEFRGRPATHFGVNRPVISASSGHPFRCDPVSRFGVIRPSFSFFVSGAAA